MGKIKSLIKNIYSEKKGEHFIKKSEPWALVFIGRVFGTPLARLFAKMKIRPNIQIFIISPHKLYINYFFQYPNYIFP